MSYIYQVNIDKELDFETAVTILKNKITNKVFINFMEFEDDWVLRVCYKLQNKGLTVNELLIQLDNYEKYLEKADYKKKYPAYYKENFFEKSIEHFICLTLLDIRRDDTILDVASEHSPLGQIFTDITECKSYSQDIMYQPGIHQNRIGCDVSSIPMPDEFFSKITATCSIEHFEQDNDILFIKEIERLLKPKGKIVIVPLYIAESPCVITDPRYALAGKVTFDKNVNVHCVENWGNRHGRFYSVETLYNRLITNCKKMHFSLYLLKNAEEINDSIYCRFILFGEKLS